MSRSLYTDLAWLPRPPEDFAARCRALGELAADTTLLGTRIQRLAGYALDENQLNRLAKAIARCRTVDTSLAPLTPFRLGVISNSTSHLLVPLLVATAARHGIALECLEGDFGQVMQEAVVADSAIHRFAPDAVLL